MSEGGKSGLAMYQADIHSCVEEMSWGVVIPNGSNEISGFRSTARRRRQPAIFVRQSRRFRLCEGHAAVPMISSEATQNTSLPVYLLEWWTGSQGYSVHGPGHVSSGSTRPHGDAGEFNVPSRQLFRLLQFMRAFLKRQFLAIGDAIAGLVYFIYVVVKSIRQCIGSTLLTLHFQIARFSDAF